MDLACYKMKTTICHLILFLGFLTLTLKADSKSKNRTEIRGGELVLIENNSVISSVKIPNELGELNKAKTLKIDWNPQGNFGISFVEGKSSNFIVGFFKPLSGKVKAVDLTPVEIGNLGMIGLKKQDLKSVSSAVLKWIERDDDYIQAEVETTVFTKSGKRMKARGPVMLAKAGDPRWR